LPIVISSPHRIDVGEKAGPEPQDYADHASVKSLSHQRFDDQLGIIRCSA